MDADRFENVLRALSGKPSRRGALHLLTGAALGLLIGPGPAPAEAKKKGKGKGKNKKRRGQKAPTCTDGILNGGESDVDCGGPCSRCGDGRRCASFNDCQSTFCTGTCQRCTITPNNCLSDAKGQCTCSATPNGNVCLQSSTFVEACSACPCAQCPPGTVQCAPVGIAAGVFCSKLCGSP